MITTESNVSQQVTPAELQAFAVKLEAFLQSHNKLTYHKPVVQIEPGNKRARVVRADQVVATGEICSRSAYAFIDLSNGDYFKPDGWSKPAKHARGNIRNEDALSGCGPYGVAYLR